MYTEKEQDRLETCLYQTHYLEYIKQLLGRVKQIQYVAQKSPTLLHLINKWCQQVADYVRRRKKAVNKYLL